MAAPALKAGGLAHRLRLLPHLALLVAACVAPALPAAFAAEDQKVWRALTEEERRAKPPVTAPDNARRPAVPLPRDLVLWVLFGAVTVVVLGAAGYGARRLRAARPGVRPRQEPEAPVDPTDVESLWKLHLRSKRRRRKPVV